MENNLKRFLDYLDETIGVSYPQDIQEIYDILRNQSNKEVEKPLFTDIGLQILEYLQSCDTRCIKAKDIASGMNESSRKISGAMRKLVFDNFVYKIGTNPVIYSLTSKGKEFNIEEYKETLNKNKEE